MTETTALVTLNHPFKIARGSIGKPLAGREVKIGPDGEILVRGASIAAQVWRHGRLEPRDAGNLEPRDASNLQARDAGDVKSPGGEDPQPDGQGWLATGDLATRNAAGELVFAGRKSEVIVTSAGLNIHPQDLEAVLRRQPGLRDALIVSYASPAGPAPAAVLIPDAPPAPPAGADDTPALERAVEAANRELAPFQQIRYWLGWPQLEFPRTSTGKVLRRQVQSWAQEALGTSGGPADGPSDPLLDLLRQLGVVNREVTAGDRLAEDLHLDSLAMVQLQSALESRFGLELDDAAWQQVKTVGDLHGLLVRHQPGPVRREESGAPTENSAAPRPDGVPAPLRAVPSQSEGAVFPRWPWWTVVHVLRIGFLEGIMRPLLWLVLAPRIAPSVGLARPSLLVANHHTAFDVPVILYALSATDRDHVAIAMSGELLTGWRRGKAQRHPIVGAFTPLAYWLVTALFNVFPLPRGAGLRHSFAHAGEAMDQGYHVLVFPEGRRSTDGRLQPFEPGIGLLAQESEVPVQPIFVEGLGLQHGKEWPKRGRVAVRLGEPLTMEPGEEPQTFTRRLEAAVAALEHS